MEKEIPSGVCFSARFIVAGAVGYADGVYYLPQNALDNFAETLKGKPVLVGHQDVIDENDMKRKAVGYVTETHRDEDGAWWADFVVFDSDTVGLIDNGVVPYVSCGYQARLNDEPIVINNVTYKKLIIGGEMLHLALVKNPRYNGTEVWRNSADDDCLVTEATLYNKKENTMNLFKKVKQEVDKELLVNTCEGEITLEQLVNDFEAAKATIAEKDAIIADQAAKIEELSSKAEEPKVEPAEEPKEIQPQVEEAPAEEPKEEKPEETDAGFKQDLNNSLSEEVKKVVIQVPNVSI